MSNEKPDSWHLDRRVPVAIIVVIVVQLIGFGALYGNIENRLTVLEHRSAERNQLPERMARLEEQISSLREVLERIDRKLERAAE